MAIFFLCSTPFFRKIRLFIICLFLGVFTLCVFWELLEWIDWQRPPCMAADGVLYIFPASTSLNVKELKNQVKGENETRDEQILHVRDDQCHGTMVISWSFPLCWFDFPTSYDLYFKSQAIESWMEHGQSYMPLSCELNDHPTLIFMIVGFVSNWKLIKGFYKISDCQKKGSCGPKIRYSTVCRVVPLPLWICKST